MTFQEAVRTCLNKYVSIDGRARRAEYWWFFLFIFAGSILASLLDNIAFGFESRTELLRPLFGIGVLLPSITAAVRRLHDRDMSGWWFLLVFIPVIGSLILLVLLVLPGSEGPNRFGPDPLRPGLQDDTHATYADSSIPKVDRE